MTDLVTAVQAELAAFPGTFGFYFEDLADGEVVSLNPNVPFPGASVIKVPLMVEIFRRAEAGELALEQKIHLPLHEARYRETDSSGILTHLTSPVDLSIADLCMLMIIESDNIATNVLYELAPQANGALEKLGLSQTRLTHPIVDFVQLRRDDANPITPREIARLYTLIYRKQLPGSDDMLAILKEQHAESLIPALLSDEVGVTFAHKTGGVQGVMHDTGLVWTERFAYVVALLTKGGQASVPTRQALARASKVVFETMRGKYG